MIKLVVTDLDGTLLRSESGNRISQYTLGVIEQLKNKGYYFAFATGRRERGAKKHIDFLNPHYAILGNGAVVMEQSTVMQKLHIPHSTTNAIIKELLTLKDIQELIIEADEFCYTNKNTKDEIPHIWEAFNMKYNDLKNGINDDVQQITLNCANHKIPSELANTHNLKCFSYREGDWHQLGHKNATKLSGIKLVCKNLGISLDQVVAFGDDYNDIDMLQGCGKGIAVFNAAEKVKQIAQEICDTNDNDGVAKWLEENLL